MSRAAPNRSRRANGDPAGARVALVQWGGDIGGAEVLTASLAVSFRELGVGAEIVFVTGAEPLADRLRRLHVPYRALGFRRGRDVLLRARRFAAAVTAAGADGAILPECGFVGAALRLGGYRGPIIGVEHGALLLERAMPPWRRAVRIAGRISGAWADDVDVGVSEFMLSRLRRAPHARLALVYNGVDPARFAPERPGASEPERPELRVGFAGRLIPGKGADDAIEALARTRGRAKLRLTIAGDGPEHDRLISLADRRGVSELVEFRGMIADMPVFWRDCDVALVPSSAFIESFGMVALEAMASGLPLVATRNGALPELVVDAVTGTLVAPRDVDAIGDALVRYAANPELRWAHGAAGRERVEHRFGIDRSAGGYLRALGLERAAPG